MVSVVAAMAEIFSARLVLHDSNRVALRQSLR